MADTAASTARTFHQLHTAFLVDAGRFRAAVAALTPADRTGRRGRLGALSRWHREYRAQLLAHHRVEDRVWFPALAARSPEFVARDEATLADDHRYLDALLAKVDVCLDRLGDRDTPFEAARADVEAAVAALGGLIADHFAHEERTVVPLLEQRCTSVDVANLGRRADREHSVRELRFLVPWFLAHLPPNERADVLAGAGRSMRVLHRLTRPRYRRLVRAAGVGEALTPAGRGCGR